MTLEPKFQVGDIVYHTLWGNEQCEGDVVHGKVLEVRFFGGEYVYHVDLPSWVLEAYHHTEAWIRESFLCSFECVIALRLMEKVEDIDDGL